MAQNPGDAVEERPVEQPVERPEARPDEPGAAPPPAHLPGEPFVGYPAGDAAGADHLLVWDQGNDPPPAEDDMT